MNTRELNTVSAGVIHLDTFRARRAEISCATCPARTRVHMEVDAAGNLSVEPMKVDKRDALMMLASSLEMANYFLNLYTAGAAHE